MITTLNLRPGAAISEQQLSGELTLALSAVQEALRMLEREHLVVARYLGPDGRPTEEWPYNPNGSPNAVAGVCDPSGRLFGVMPHPDAYLYPFHHPQWTKRKLTGAPLAEGDGMKIFRNGVAAAMGVR
jgi:phosphoribosylformylglycinamidine synthase